jgi:hypothetical protein
VQVIDGRSFTRGTRFEAFGAGFGGGVFVAAGFLGGSGQERLIVGAGGQDGSPGDEPVLRAFDGAGTLLHDFVFAFEPGFHGGVTVATFPGLGRRQDVILAGPAQTHAARVVLLDALFAALPQSFSIADGNFANGVSVG